MMTFKCHSETKAVEGSFRFKVGTVWGLLVDPVKDDKFVALSRIEKTETGTKLKQEIISVDKLKKCFWRIA